MRSPNKDLFMDVEEATSSKDGFWDFDADAFGNGETNAVSSSFAFSESLVHELAENPVDTARDVALPDPGEAVTKSPCKKQTARKSVARGTSNNLETSEEQNTEIKIEPNLDDDLANNSAKVLHFFCQKCKNGIRYSPNDLQKHFLICHNGELPLYPCEMCNFAAQNFQEFKQHRKTHQGALVKCEICNNDYLYTLLGLTKHFTVMHCVNGHFSCSKCRFSTRDVGTFVQHIHRHNGIEYACQKCNHISYSKIEFQRHLQGHSTLFPFSCQYCSYSAMRKDFIIKHVLAKHREHVHTRDEPTVQDHSKSQMVPTDSGLKLGLKKYQTETQDKSLWKQGGNNPGIGNAGGNIDSTTGFHYRTQEKKLSAKDFPGYNTDSGRTLNDGSSSVTTIKCNKEDAITQGNMGLLQNAVHGPTVLMVKNNKITVPANYTATFVGYKMVNGKQNLVIKLLPSNKQASNSSQPSPQTSNSLPHFSQGSTQGSYGSKLNTIDNRLNPPFKFQSTQASATQAKTEKPAGSLRSLTTALGSLMARRNESVSKPGVANRQPHIEKQNKSLHGLNAPNSTSGHDVRKIKAEPEEYNINEQQFFDKDHKYESSGNRMNTASGSGALSVDPTTGFLYRPRHNSESSVPSKPSYNKDFDSLFLHASTASGLGNYSCTGSKLMSKNDFAVRNAQLNDRLSRLENKKCDNVTFMPRITSVFSLQNRQPEPLAQKRSFMHNMLQESKRINDKIFMSRPPSTHTTSNSFTFTKPTLSSPLSKFDNRLSNGNVTQSAILMKQEPVSPSSNMKTSLSPRVSELLKTHTDVIVNQQLAKDKMSTMSKVPVGSASFQMINKTNLSGMSHANSVLHTPTSNRFVLPVASTHQPGLKISPSQTSAPSNTFPTPSRVNAPVMINSRPGMVLTIANGPFGTIRNVTNGGSQYLSGMNNLGKMALPRLQRPPVPNNFKPTLTASSNNLSANIVSGSSIGSSVPVNLNVLQYCLNSDSSRAATASVEASKQETLQKQPVYALMPDGKQAVLLNYVLPKISSANTQNPVQLNRINQKVLPKKPDDPQQVAFLKNRNQANLMATASIKDEDTSAFDGYGRILSTTKVNHLGCLQDKSAERKPCLRSSGGVISADESLYSANDEKTLSQPSAANSKMPKVKCKQNNMMAANSKSKAFKRKMSADSGCYEADFEFKTKKRIIECLQDVPRKRMLHRKCKAKSYASDVDSLPEDDDDYDDDDTTAATPSPQPPPAPPSKDTVRTLRLFPFSSDQLVKYPESDQPVVVLNHPDADVPEVVNVMRTISKFNGHVLKVSLSKRTLEALLESKLLNSGEGSSSGRHRRSKPISPVKERFVLKLTLKKTSKNNYKIVKNTPVSNLQSKFNCWFCGRIFDNQDEWVAHGQRHLMEATKDWNTLF